MTTLGKSALFGLLAGMMMAMAGMMMTAAIGTGFFALPAMMGDIIFGPEATVAGGAGVVLAGLMLHMMLSAMFGVVFALIVQRWPKDAIGTGAIFGIALWYMNFHLLARFSPAAAAMAAMTPAWIAIATHLIFGVAIGALERTAIARAGGPVRA